MDSFRADQNITTDFPGGLAGCAVGKTRCHTRFILFEGFEMLSGANFVFTQPLLRRFQEQHLQAAAMH
jgi:hypothetical protein